MTNLLPVFAIFQLIVIAYVLLRLKMARKRAERSEREVERLNAQSRLLENNVAHSEAIFKVYKDSNKLSVAFFTEENSEDGYFKKSVKLRYKSQLYLNGIPIGAASTLKEDVVTVIDREKVDQALERYARPLMEAGVLVLKLAEGGKLGALGSSGAKSSLSNRQKT